MSLTTPQDREVRKPKVTEKKKKRATTKRKGKFRRDPTKR